MKNYRDLDIYNDAKKLAIEIYKMSLALPKFEMYEQGSQISRSSKSVVALIMEGYGRRKYKQNSLNILFIHKLNAMKQ
ncbi:MAG TPA: four helix bundle protein [Chitinophagaceae bacterium]